MCAVRNKRFSDVQLQKILSVVQVSNRAFLTLSAVTLKFSLILVQAASPAKPALYVDYCWQKNSAKISKYFRSQQNSRF